MKFEFVDDNEKRYSAKIKVFGVGGAGGNAINNMITSKLKGVDFITANTDSQDLERSVCSSKIQLGTSLTRGLGAGSDPEIGEAAAEESVNDIRESGEGGRHGLHHRGHGRRHRDRGRADRGPGVPGRQARSPWPW